MASLARGNPVVVSTHARTLQRPKDDGCPLTPALRRVLEACARLNTTSTAKISAAIRRSPNTVRSEFYRIMKQLGVRSRTEALMMALRNDWVALNS